MILAYAQRKKGDDALKLFARMQEHGVVPNDRTFVGALKTCCSLAEVDKGGEGGTISVKKRCLDTVRAIHTDIVKRKLESDVYVGTMLVDVYAKCGSLEDARHVFDSMPRFSMISGYSQTDRGEETLELFGRMQQEGVVPNNRTYASVLKACSSLAELAGRNEADGVALRKRSLDIVRAIHSDVMKRRLNSDVFEGTMLVDVYAKCRRPEDARTVFEKMPCRTVVSWNAMILGYTEMDEGEAALQLYSRMQLERVVPDKRTYVGALSDCGSVAGLEKGMEIHTQILKAGVENMDSFVMHSLIDVYGKCGSMAGAQEVFDAMPMREGVTWNVVIAGMPIKERVSVSLTCLSG